MTGIALGAALMANETPATLGAPPSLPQPLLAVSPTPALPTLPIRFGEQLRQSLAADALPDLPATPNLPGKPALNNVTSEQASAEDELAASDAQPVIPNLITFTQPISVPLEYAQRSTGFVQQQQQASLPINAVSQTSQPVATRENASFATAETYSLGAVTINAAAMSLASKGAPVAATTETQSSSLPVAQLASLTNNGLAQALVEGMSQQPGMLVPVNTQPAQSINTQRSALEVALGDRLQLQISQRSEHAVIRLDPPSMGTIEIVIHREAGNIQVHLRASNSEVARQLHGIGDSLRQDLVNRQNGDVSVHVSDSSREQYAGQQSQRQSQSQSQAQREAPGRALSESNEESTKAFTLAVDEERAA